MHRAGESSKILRDMRKGKKSAATAKLNTSRYVDPGYIMSHVAQGILKNARMVKRDHVIWHPASDRSENRKHGEEKISYSGHHGPDWNNDGNGERNVASL